MRRIISALIIIIVSCSINIAHAAGPDDFVIIQTKDFLYACGIQDKGFGYKAILTKAFAESAEGKTLLQEFAKCKAEYHANNADAQHKPEEIIESLRKHSLAQTLWGDVKFIDGNRYIAVTKSLHTSADSNIIWGGWGCIDDKGKTVIPMKYGYIIEGNTNINAIVFAESMGNDRMPGAARRIGVMRNDGTIALKPNNDEVHLVFNRWIVIHECNNINGGYNIFDKNYNVKISNMGYVDYQELTKKNTGFFVISDARGLKALFNDSLRRITDFKFVSYSYENNQWKGTTDEGDTTVIDTRNL